MEQKDLLYFLHIPKTGGTSFTRILDDQFNYSDICPDQKWDGLLEKPREGLSKYKLLRGHFGYQIKTTFSQKPVYITMLRNPIERTLSSYEHIKRDLEEKKLSSKIFLGKKELKDFFNDPNTRGMFTNSQVRHIGLDIDATSKLKTNEDKENFQYSRFFTNPEIEDKKLLDVAKTRLSKFSFIGITERFEESLMLLSYTFGWRPVLEIPRENISENRTDRGSISHELFNQIQTDTKYDSELYEYAKEIFQNRFSSMIKKLKESYLTPEFKKLPFNEMMFNLLEKCYENSNNSEKPVSVVNYDFSRPIYGTGWYKREIQPFSGIIFRWSGPEIESKILFSIVPKGDMIIEIRIINFLNPDVLKNLTLEVNNTKIDLKMNAENRTRTFVGIIPEFVFHKGVKLVKLKFHVNRTEKPNSKNPKFQGTRLLGLAFEKIKMFPKYNNPSTLTG